jgi:hypothetical protein
MTGIDPLTMQQIRIGRAMAMSHDAKVAYLAARGWKCTDGTHWRHKQTGARGLLTNAVVIAMEMDPETMDRELSTAPGGRSS